MKINQNVRHFAYRKALETPGIRSVARRGLVSLHTRVFLKRVEEGREEERRDRLDALFAGTIDAYLAALQDGYSEAEAREITHVQANFDFFNHGWTEMMEFPTDEVEAHYERHREFFEKYDITIDDPLGAFHPEEGLPDAPATLEKLDNPVHPHAEGGFADDVYVDTGEEVLQGEGIEEPENVDPTDIPEVDGEVDPNEDGDTEASEDKPKRRPGGGSLHKLGEDG